MKTYTHDEEMQAQMKEWNNWEKVADSLNTLSERTCQDFGPNSELTRALSGGRYAIMALLAELKKKQVALDYVVHNVHYIASRPESQSHLSDEDALEEILEYVQSPLIAREMDEHAGYSEDNVLLTLEEYADFMTRLANAERFAQLPLHIEAHQDKDGHTSFNVFEHRVADDGSLWKHKSGGFDSVEEAIAQAAPPSVPFLYA